jgi:hypothetical protein
MKHRSIVLLLVMGLGLGLGTGLHETAFAGSEEGEKFSFHGYGELHYNNPKSGSTVPGESDPAAMDFHRMVWGLSYHWTDRISLHTEVDFEHAAQEMELEYAYVDFLVNPAFNVRAGAVLMPAGPLNEFHEPTLFYSVERPYVQNAIIPTTWQEGGAGLFGSLLQDLKYRLYVVSGLSASDFSDSTGIRGGRGKVAGGSGSVAKVPPRTGEELAGVGRLEYVGIPGLSLGTSGYTGGANQTTEDALESVRVTLLEGDFRYRIAGLDIQGVYAQINVSDPEKITTTSGTPPVTTFKKIGEKMVGWYGEAAYHLLGLISPETEQDLVAFVRWEQINTQEEVPAEYEADPSNDRRVLTYGLAYFPHRDVAIKVDQERWKDKADNKEKRINVGLAYMF